MTIAVWNIRDGVPVPARSGSVELEKHLEAWIEQDPGLVGEGLKIVARQAHLGDAGRADLLAVDPAGRWVVIEVKAGKLSRDTVAQGIDYAAALSSLDETRLRAIVGDYIAAAGGQLPEDDIFEQPRDVTIVLVGTRAARGLQRIADYLSPFGVPVRSVIFDVLDCGGDLILLREVTDADEAVAPPTTQTGTADVLKLAEQAGVRPAMQLLLDVAERHSLHVRPWKKCVMLAPPASRSRCLVTAWANDGPKGLWCSLSGLDEFYGPLSDEMRAALGGGVDQHLSETNAKRVAEALDRLLAADDL